MGDAAVRPHHAAQHLQLWRSLLCAGWVCVGSGCSLLLWNLFRAALGNPRGDLTPWRCTPFSRRDSQRLGQTSVSLRHLWEATTSLEERGQRRENLDVRSAGEEAFSPLTLSDICYWSCWAKLATLRDGMRNNINLLVIIRQMVSSLLHPICTTQSCCAKDEFSVAWELPGWACEWGKMVSGFAETLLCSPQKYSFRGNDFPSPVRLRRHIVSIWNNFGNVRKRRGKLWVWLWRGE